MRAKLSILVLASLVIGCGPEEPSSQSSNKMGQARPVPPPPVPAPPVPLPPGAVVAQGCTGATPLGTTLRPLTEGPLQLDAVACSATVFAEGSEANLVSPDGTAVATLDNGPDMAVRIRPIAGGDGVTMPAPSSSLQLTMRGPAALAWSGDSAFLWGATQARVRPNGWALEGLRPVRFFLDGHSERLPPLVHSGGPLDGLLWAGTDGLALAEFGTRGRYYQPEHEDRTPILAFVDARRGRVLDTLPMAGFRQPSTPAFAGPVHWVRQAAVTILADGRLRAVLMTPDWFVWTQGERLRRLGNPYPADRGYDMVLAPNGNKMLVVRGLQPEGVICYEHDPRGCTRGRSVEGVLAALHDLRAGAPRWTIRARVVRSHSYPTPAISPDGRYALIGLPEGDDMSLALVSMRDGRVLQKLPTLGRGSPKATLGFQSPSRLWVRTANVTAFYRFGAGR